MLMLVKDILFPAEQTELMIQYKRADAQKQQKSKLHHLNFDYLSVLVTLPHE